MTLIIAIVIIAMIILLLLLLIIIIIVIIIIISNNDNHNDNSKKIGLKQSLECPCDPPGLALSLHLSGGFGALRLHSTAGRALDLLNLRKPGKIWEKWRKPMVKI